MKQLLVFLFSLIVLAGSAQSINPIWYFGNRCGLDFTSGSPVAITNSMMYADEGCITISATNGTLLFYSNGDTVWDASHTPMPNGTGLSGQLSCSQSSLAIRKPGSTTIFYIFTQKAQGNPGGLCWSEIDMSLNAGMGDVTSNKNVPLITPSCEQMAAVRHANGIDVWVVVHGLNSNSFYAYLITSSGVSAPVISSVGTTINSSFNMVETIGCMKFSCDGLRLAISHYGDTLMELFDYNKATGVISNSQILSTGYIPYGVEFSANCDYLYVSGWSWFGAPIYQYDLTSANIPASQMQIGTVPSSLGAAAALQMGPDHKIYIAVLFADSLSVIQNPDNGGLASNFLANGVYLGGRTSFYGLPNMLTGLYCIPPNPDGVTENSGDDLISVYPNPASDVITIDARAMTAPFEICIYNSLGELVFAQNYSLVDAVQVDCGNFSPGIYSVAVRSEKKTVRKIISKI